MTQQAPFFKFLEQNSHADLLLCEDEKEAKALRDVAVYHNKEVIVFPDFRASYGDDLRSYKEELEQLFFALRNYYTAKNPLVISPLKTLLFRLPKQEYFSSFTLEFGEEISLKKLQNKLIYWGYNFVDIVELEGEVSFRGDIIDIYIPLAKNPYRLSLFDTEIEQIKEFDITKQRTLEGELETITITPAFLALNEAEYEQLSHTTQNSSFDTLTKDITSLGFWHLDNLAENFLEGKEIIANKNFDQLLDEVYNLNAPQIERKFFCFEVLKESEGYKEILPANPSMLLRVHSKRECIVLAQNRAILKQYALSDENFLYKESPLILNVLTPDKLIISLNKEQKKARRRKTTLLLDELNKGDYVVHEEYGVGVFDGITQAEILGGVKDFVTLRYMGDDKVMLPVENLESIERYIGAGGALPTLDRLGKGGFAKLKESVRKKLFAIAANIVNTAATRALIEAPKIECERMELQAFSQKAGFSYTSDQTKAIEAILEELGSGNIMDKLLSGDVGFGKTEVAMNAIFATKKGGFQSAFIVPTTLLSSQHFRSLEQRFKFEGISVAKFDRFVSTKEKNTIKKELENGEIDCVVGTHALFNLKFKNLGLVIVDEEHKFGVKQKEKIKELYHNVHMLSMSATPIPRSLNQALSKIKTLSELLTPPRDRQDVRTFVKEWDEKLIKEVCAREIRRGGQIFYVHNSIENMPLKLGELKAVMPTLRVVMLHSKTGAAQTEKELLAFEAGEYDMLLSTSIVESGIHMPKVNTIIVDGADRFGIADLHQLRGRVGRSKTEGFAYFLVQEKERLGDEAKKRLLALESNSYLGSGSTLAHHDLEIRGGGNLIGDAQSGHIKNIGYSLYLKMLEDAILELTNNTKTKTKKVDIKLSISAYIDSRLVAEDRLRLDLYRRLSQAKEVVEIYEIESEIYDRFGSVDETTKKFIELVVVKLLAKKQNISSIMNYAQNITITFEDGKKESLKASSKDDEDILFATLAYLKKHL